MRSRRHKLQVSTFPFLAVLLCAMGALLLVLLVMDRRAHDAARQRAEEAARRAAEETGREAGARRAALEEAREQARAARRRERDEEHARLESQEMGVKGEILSAREQMALAAQRLRAEQDDEGSLKQKIEAEHAEAREEEQALVQVQGEEQKSAAELGSQRLELKEMTSDLAQMERTLADLKKAREKEQKTYSVVPYNGKRGENRQPLYVECAPGQVIFHPDRLALPDENNDGALQAEVERRSARMKERLPPARAAAYTPYLMLLVRPEGVIAYYRLREALRGMKIDFGYEFVERDWVLDFPADDQDPLAQPWMAAAKPSAPVEPGGPTRRLIGLAPGAEREKGPNSPNLGGGPPDAPGASAAGAAGTPGSTGFAWTASTGTNGSAGAYPAGRGDGTPGKAGFSGPASAGTDATAGGATAGSLGPPRPFAPDGAPGVPGSAGGAANAGGSSGPALSAAPSAGPSSSPGGVAAAPVDGPAPTAAGQGAAAAGPGGTGGNGADVDGAMRPGTPSAAAGPHTNGGSPTGPWGPAEAAGGTTTGATAGGATAGGATQADKPSLPPVPGPSNAASAPAGAAGTDRSSAPSEAGAPASAGTSASAGASASASSSGPQGTAATAKSATPSSSGHPGGAKGDRAAGDPDDDPFLRMPPPPPLPHATRPAPALRPARLSGDRDWILYVECKPEGVVIYPSQLLVPVSVLGRDSASNPLFLTLQQMIDRKQATVRRGDAPYRPEVRFLVHPEAGRTYHLAYPTLDALAAPKTAQNLGPGDDVPAIVTGH